MKLLTYDKEHCYQYERKLETLEEDKELVEKYSLLSANEFFLSKEEYSEEISEFIKRYEWLGKLHGWTTDIYTARTPDKVLGGVVALATPNSFSKLLGDGTKHLEKLISRGASASWTPKNLASRLIMYSLRDMVNTTEFRVFTAYADPMALELGTIYQACNFYYLGQAYGSVTGYYHDDRPDLGIVGSRYFTYRSAYVRYAKDLGIEWLPEWYTEKRKVNWKNIPKEVVAQLKERMEEVKSEWHKVSLPKKHKYAQVLGKTKSETRKLRKLFENLNKTYSYPKERGS